MLTDFPASNCDRKTEVRPFDTTYDIIRFRLVRFLLKERNALIWRIGNRWVKENIFYLSDLTHCFRSDSVVQFAEMDGLQCAECVNFISVFTTLFFTRGLVLYHFINSIFVSQNFFTFFELRFSLNPHQKGIICASVQNILAQYSRQDQN